MLRFFVWSLITARILMFQRKSSNICLKVHQNGGDIAARFIFVFRFWPLNLGIQRQLFKSLNRARYSAMYGRLEVEWATDGNQNFLCVQASWSPRSRWVQPSAGWWGRDSISGSLTGYTTDHSDCQNVFIFEYFKTKGLLTIFYFYFKLKMLSYSLETLIIYLLRMPKNVIVIKMHRTVRWLLLL